MTSAELTHYRHTARPARLSRQQREVLSWVAAQNGVALPSSPEKITPPREQSVIAKSIDTAALARAVEGAVRAYETTAKMLPALLASASDFLRSIAKFADVDLDVLDDAIRSGKIDGETLATWDKLRRQGLLDPERVRAQIIEASLGAYAYWDATSYLGRSPTPAERASLSRTMQRLADRDLIRRRRRPGQRQKRLVRITAAGITALTA